MENSVPLQNDGSLASLKNFITLQGGTGLVLLNRRWGRARREGWRQCILQFLEASYLRIIDI